MKGKQTYDRFLDTFKRMFSDILDLISNKVIELMVFTNNYTYLECIVVLCDMDCSKLNIFYICVGYLMRLP